MCMWMNRMHRLGGDDRSTAHPYRIKSVCKHARDAVVPPSTTIDSLRSFFQSYGAIRDGACALPIDRNTPRAMMAHQTPIEWMLISVFYNNPRNTVRIVTPRQEDRRAYAFVEFEQVRSAVAAIEEMQFRVSDAALVI